MKAKQSIVYANHGPVNELKSVIIYVISSIATIHVTSLLKKLQVQSTIVPFMTW